MFGDNKLEEEVNKLSELLAYTRAGTQSDHEFLREYIKKVDQKNFDLETKVLKLQALLNEIIDDYYGE